MNLLKVIDLNYKKKLNEFLVCIGQMTFIFIITIIIYTSTPIFAGAKEIQNEDQKKLEQMTLEELLSVEVTTAGKKKEKIGEIPASVVVITRQDIEKYGYQTLSEILANIPGLYFTDDYLTQNIGIRGFWTVDSLRDIVVLVNDVQQTEYLANSNFMELFAIPVESIDRIEVVRGPMSVIYGNGAFFGAINIFTNKIEKNDPVNSVTLSMGSEKKGKIVVRASNKGDDYQYAFNGSFSKTNGLDKPLNKMGPYTGSTKDKLESSEKYFNFSGTFKDLTIDSSYSESHKESYVLLPSITDGTLIIFKALRINAGYRHNFSNSVKLNAKFGYFLNHWTFDFDWLYPDFYGEQTNGNSGFNSELNLFVDPSPNLKLIIGLNYTNVPFVQADYTIPAFNLNLIHNNLSKNESITTQSFFAQSDYRLSEKINIVGGFRLDYMPSYTSEMKIGNFDPTQGNYTIIPTTYSYKKIVFIPRLAFIYSIDKKNSLKFLYGKAINRPSFFQTLDPVNNPGIELSPLQPETIQTFEINFTGNLRRDFSLSVSLFKNILDKLIFRTFFTTAEGKIVSYQANVGKMNTVGAELTAQYSPSDKLQLELSMTYQKTKDKRESLEDITPGYSPKFLGYIKTSLFLTEDISFALTGNYVDKMEAYWDTTLSPNGGRIGKAVSGYFLLGANFRVNYLFGTGLFANLRCSNLLNKEIYYPATSNNSGFAPNGTIGQGISFLLTFGWRF